MSCFFPEVTFLCDVRRRERAGASGQGRQGSHGRWATGQSFGTWALFDNRPADDRHGCRDLHLFEDPQRDFYDLLADHDEITPAMFKLLSKE